MADSLPYLNLGAGRLILPFRPGTFEAEKADWRMHELPDGYGRPVHHALVDEAIYSYPHWHNVDRNAEPGIDQCVDLFTYPWPLESDSYGGALLSHLCEHIPHEIKICDPRSIIASYNDGETVIYDGEHAGVVYEDLGRLAKLQDGYYAFFAELYRVLEHGAIAHILSPYAWSQGAVTDPTHTRLITEHTFTHSMQPDPNSPFKYETGGIHFEMVRAPNYSVTPAYAHLVIQPGDDEQTAQRKTMQFQEMVQSRINVVYDISVQLRAVKA